MGKFPLTVPEPTGEISATFSGRIPSPVFAHQPGCLVRRVNSSHYDVANQATQVPQELWGMHWDAGWVFPWGLGVGLGEGGGEVDEASMVAWVYLYLLIYPITSTMHVGKYTKNSGWYGYGSFFVGSYFRKSRWICWVSSFNSTNVSQCVVLDILDEV